MAAELQPLTAEEARVLRIVAARTIDVQNMFERDYLLLWAMTQHCDGFVYVEDDEVAKPIITRAGALALAAYDKEQSK